MPKGNSKIGMPINLLCCVGQQRALLSISIQIHMFTESLMLFIIVFLSGIKKVNI